MPAARPSKAAVANVIAALKEAGEAVGEVVVDAQGGFVVRPKVDTPAQDAPKVPRRWGQTG